MGALSGDDEHSLCQAAAMREPLIPGEPPVNRLTTGSKVAFAVGGCPAQVSGTIIGFFVNPWLLDVVGMRAVNVSYILLVGRVCDAFSDPLVGWLSDRTQSRCGLHPDRAASRAARASRTVRARAHRCVARRWPLVCC